MDFNNLLCIINSYSELLLHRTDLSVDDREALEAIHEAGERGASLTSQLLVFGRKAVFAPKAVDLNEVVVDASRILTRLAGENIVFQQVLSPKALRSSCGSYSTRSDFDQFGGQWS